MSARSRWSRATRLGMIVVLSVASASPADARNDAFFARFARHVRADAGLDEAARRIVLEALAGRGEETDDEALLAEALVLMSPEFRAGLQAYEEENYEACQEALDRISRSADLYLRCNAQAYAAKALVHANRLIEAQARIEALAEKMDEFRRYSLDEAELQYMLGYCQVQNLEHDRARRTLERFLADYPEASARLVVTARQMLAELARRIPRSMGEVADMMAFSEKRLAAGSSGDRLRRTHERIIELLDTLIEQIEEAEKSQQSGGDQSQARRQRQSRPDQANRPLPDSQLPPGQPEQSAKRPGRRANPGEAWGAMPEAQRERILQVLRDRFPGRYRALLEQYYQSLAEQP